MNYKEFIDKAKKHELKSVYLFYGEEEYLIDYTVLTLKNIYIDSSLEALNYVILDGKSLKFDSILNACETLPFMSEKKIVVIKDFPLFSNKREKEEISEEFKLPPSKNPLIKYFGELPDYLCLIFVEKDESINKSNALYKSIINSGELVEFAKLKGNDLNDWVEKSFKKYNKKISKSSINYFVQQSSYLDSNYNRTLYDLENEIIKISNYLSNGEEVTNDIIDLLMSKPLEMNVFNLLNSISQKNGEKAIRLFNEMYRSNEPVLFILHMIVRQLRNMLNYKVLRLKGYSEGDVFSKMNLKQYEYRKVANQSSNFTIPQLERAMFYCLEADKIIKSSSIDDRLALEILITNLCFKI
ncbi:DNA polymerase III subunit delta [Tepidimicrobium xylanilyticum]|uniref:DNA polymerase III subunit delta n=1 Tax=Tepidimicrobium xylanilyticum TaxID=1123352 RepID=A0A1H2T5W9_9FIRM|nr:DNA polymerase III subunit delta [Tepidimicrobium xylanilyticum]GMG96020.1 DNA polymerase III subunit delta [Tepidimicrobium xylanilyticum]SDW39271.1 DNA polymerase III, delta subunit [Tepidimicrobium xylanilyticum]